MNCHLLYCAGQTRNRRVTRADVPGGLVGYTEVRGEQSVVREGCTLNDA